MLGSGSLGVWLGRQAEKEVIGACEAHLNKIFTIVDKFQEFTNNYCDNDKEEAQYKAKEIVALEREADSIK